MFKILRPSVRPSVRPGERTKRETGAGASQDRVGAPAARVDPPRIVLPRHRAAPATVSPDQAAPPKPSHLKSVDPARVPSRAPAPPVSRPAASRVAQPIQPAQPARPVIPPYPVPGARAKADKPAAPGAEVQSFGRLMLVGPQVRLNGEIGACERLVVEGLVEGVVSETGRLEVARGGRFHGAAQVETCMVDGEFEGELDVQGVLTLKANGLVMGTVRYGQIEIERGGVIAGTFGARDAAEGAGQAAAPQAARPPSTRPLKSGGPRSA